MGEASRKDDCDAVVVGAGWAGMYMLYRLREDGYRVRGYEAGSEVGGTWFWNCYPGARCDTHSLSYSYSFSDELQQEWDWKELYAPQAEIAAYAGHVADRFDIRKDFRFNTRVVAARLDEQKRRWIVSTDTGESVSTKYVIMATGGYSIPARPDIEGLDDFEGELYLTAQWPHRKVEFADKRIGVIGTGASGTQLVTALSTENVDHLYVFQRTANYAVPGWNRQADKQYTAEFKHQYAAFRETARQSADGTVYPPIGGMPERTVGPLGCLSDEQVQDRLEELWQCGGLYMVTAVSDLMTSERVNGMVADFLRSMIRRRVKDPEVAKLLSPHGQFVGARRVVVENGYFEAFNQGNVTLVDVKSNPITKIGNDRVCTMNGEYPLDMLILATGFDSGSGAVLQVELVGRHGIPLSDKWKAGPRLFLGLMVEGFPNLFTIAQAGSPSIRSQLVVSIEQHVDWIMDMLTHMRESGAELVQPTLEAEGAWSDHVQALAENSLFTRHSSQYTGANIAGKPEAYLAYLGGVGTYREICNRVVENGYEGFVFEGPGGTSCTSRTWSGNGRSVSVLGSVV